MKDIKDAMSYINSYSKLGKRISGLSRIAKLLDSLGNPQNKLNFVHIAGTNGKGSVLELCSQACINSKYRVGQFTSPYIKCYADRIRINGENISDTKLLSACEIVKSKAIGNEYSQFEITFAIALIYFVNQNCDIVFLETGIGGKFDATNIIPRPLASIITSISLDHTDLLGDTIEEIANQKAGIIKENCPAVLSYDNPENVIKIIEETCGNTHSKLIIPETDSIVPLKLDLGGSSFIYKSNQYFLKMLGKHQIINAVTALETLDILRKSGFQIPVSAVQKSFSEIQIHARIEILNKNPLVILDGGHNDGGVNSLIKIIPLIPEKPIIAIIGMLQNKDFISVSKALSQHIDIAICVDGFALNCVSAKDLSNLFNCEKYSISCIDAMDKALKIIDERGGGSIIICGSLYLASYVINEGDISNSL